ncbi:MAG: HNH endonuclease signature motif containing protein [Thermoplasmatales archaeon]|jgi:hypothetical protein|nr:HNH endonuclease signature motif containing protein [Thermoplasmatales archaeon]
MEEKNNNIELDLVQIFKDVIDYLSPLQTPTEQAIYNYLLRWSYYESGTDTIQIGDRTLAKSIATPSRKDSKSVGLAPQAVGENIRSLVKKGHIEILEITNLGKKYKIILPEKIEACLKLKQEKNKLPNVIEEDYFTNPEKRRLIFERDNYTCDYCGEKVTEDTATLDHIVPRSKGGTDSKDNLVTCCFECNSIKSGKTLEEVATILLERLKQKRKKSN